MGIIVVDNEQEAKDFVTNDPATKINRYEYFPMKAVVPTKQYLTVFEIKAITEQT